MSLETASKSLSSDTAVETDELLLPIDELMEMKRSAWNRGNTVRTCVGASVVKKKHFNYDKICLLSWPRAIQELILKANNKRTDISKRVRARSLFPDANTIETDADISFNEAFQIFLDSYNIGPVSI